MRGPTSKLRDCAFVLAQDASLRGIETIIGSLNVLGDPANYINLSGALDAEFLRVLDAAGLKPLIVHTSGRRLSS